MNVKLRDDLVELAEKAIARKDYAYLAAVSAIFVADDGRSNYRERIVSAKAQLAGTFEAISKLLEHA